MEIMEKAPKMSLFISADMVGPTYGTGLITSNLKLDKLNHHR